MIKMNFSKLSLSSNNFISKIEVNHESFNSLILSYIIMKGQFEEKNHAGAAKTEALSAGKMLQVLNSYKVCARKWQSCRTRAITFNVHVYMNQELLKLKFSAGKTLQVLNSYKV